jgi:hypothetical protein
MRNHLTSRNAGFFVAGGFAAVLVLSGAAHAITDTAFRYSTPQTGWLSIPPAAFMPISNAYTWANFGYSLTGNTNAACFSAAVNLPQGAKMTAFAFWYQRNDSNNGNFTIALHRQNLKSGSVDEIATIAAANTGGVRKAFSNAITNVSLQTVNNAAYNYVINQCVSATETFYGARIAYSYTTAGD